MLVVGLGPAGYTLAHYLLNEGFGVVGIDGLKIEPLPAEQSGVGADGARVPFAPVRDVDDAARADSTSASWRASAASPSTASPCAGTRTS